MNEVNLQVDPSLPRLTRKRRQDPAILITVFAFAIAVTPEFSFAGIPKVRITDLLLLPLLAYLAPSVRGPKRNAPLMGIMALVILWDALVLFSFGSPDTLKTGILYLGKRVSYYLIFLVGYMAVQSRAVWERTISGLLMATPLFALSVLWSVRTDTNYGEAQRASGIIANQEGSTALFFVILLTLCLGALPVWRSPFARIIGLATLATGIPAMLATGTRGALVDIIFGVGALEVLRRDVTRSLMALIGVAALLVGAWNFVPKALQARLSETIPHLRQAWENRDRSDDFAGGNSAAARVAMARSCIQKYISKAPITGNGMASRNLGFVDNFFLTEWTYNGLVGLVLMLIFLVRMGVLLFHAYKHSRDLLEKGIAAGVLASYLAMWMATLHADSFYLIRPMEALMLLAGLVVGCQKLEAKGILSPTRKKRRRTFGEILQSEYQLS